jgi:hypothetical protein
LRGGEGTGGGRGGGWPVVSWVNGTWGSGAGLFICELTSFVNTTGGKN